MLSARVILISKAWVQNPNKKTCGKSRLIAAAALTCAEINSNKLTGLFVLRLQLQQGLLLVIARVLGKNLKRRCMRIQNKSRDATPAACEETECPVPLGWPRGHLQTPALPAVLGLWCWACVSLEHLQQRPQMHLHQALHNLRRTPQRWTQEQRKKNLNCFQTKTLKKLKFVLVIWIHVGKRSSPTAEETTRVIVAQVEDTRESHTDIPGCSLCNQKYAPSTWSWYFMVTGIWSSILQNDAHHSKVSRVTMLLWRQLVWQKWKLKSLRVHNKNSITVTKVKL